MSEKSMLELERCGYRSLATGYTGVRKGDGLSEDGMGDA